MPSLLQRFACSIALQLQKSLETTIRTLLVAVSAQRRLPIRLAGKALARKTSRSALWLSGSENAHRTITGTNLSHMG